MPQDTVPLKDIKEMLTVSGEQKAISLQVFVISTLVLRVTKHKRSFLMAAGKIAVVCQ